MTIDSPSADSEKNCVLAMALFPGNALRIARKRDKNPGQVFRQMPRAVNPRFTKLITIKGCRPKEKNLRPASSCRQSVDSLKARMGTSEKSSHSCVD
jgi:hypothetical protein